MRKGLGFITWIAWIVLMFSLTTHCPNPLGPNYVPNHNLLELVVVGATLYLLGAYLVGRAVSQRALVRSLFGAVALFTVAAVVWGVYHAQYGEPPMVQDWDSYTKVTPYHEQLALPAFIGLAGGIAILAVALRREPLPTLGPLTS
jgi:hypothetical protein